MHIQSVVDLFAKKLYNALNVPKITNRRAKSHKYGRYTADFSQNPILDFDPNFGNGWPSPSLLEHPQPLSRPNERAIQGGGNGFYPRTF